MSASTESTSDDSVVHGVDIQEVIHYLNLTPVKLGKVEQQCTVANGQHITNFQPLQVAHQTVNHSLHFVDPVTGVHTEGVEAMWSTNSVTYNTLFRFEMQNVLSLRSEYGNCLSIPYKYKCEGVGVWGCFRLRRLLQSKAFKKRPIFCMSFH